MTTPSRKKLIEVSIPLEAINEASAREKSIRHGHPSTLHLWWARRPLAACRAVLFAQVVDDPSAWCDRFPSVEQQDAERRRLHKIIEALVPWSASDDPVVLNAARWEIARSIAWNLGEEPPPPDDPAAVIDYLQLKGPPVYDPFSGAGSIPLEAQRLGLRAYGSDVNPVAVLIGKALVEIPPKFAGAAPVNPVARARVEAGFYWNGKGAEGLAEDLRYYGQWVRDEAQKRIGRLYPKAMLLDGTEADVVAWLWARTVCSPDPAAKRARVPLVSSFMISTKKSQKAWVEPVIDPDSPDGWRFQVHTGNPDQADEERLKQGTRGAGSSADFRCILTGSTITGKYIKSEGMAGRMQARLMAIVAKGERSRAYLSPTPAHEALALSLQDDDRVEDARGGLLAQPVPARLTGGTCYSYGLTTFDMLFTPRQLIALTTFSDLIGEARERVQEDAAAERRPDERRLHEGGSGPAAYADAIATYLAFAVSKLADRGSSICSWFTERDSTRPTFARQAIPMTWDYAELNTLLDGTGSFEGAVQWTAESLAAQGLAGKVGAISNINASANSFPVRPALISTDPPYYNNIAYADLSDFFYLWLRRSLKTVWPELFRRLTTPKAEELVATPYRHGSKKAADAFFMEGMAHALTAMRDAALDNEPLAIYYAFKQSEVAAEGITSAGWASFLQAVINAGLWVDGTWPIRTELANRMIGRNANALASSVVLVCRKRPNDAAILTRADFVRALKREMPDAIDAIRKAGVGPVDMQQSVIGPGMGIFSRHAKVLEDDDRPMTVKTALALINRTWEEIENELDAAFDSETQVALAWYASYGFDARTSGQLITLTTAKNTSDRALFQRGIFEDRKGKTALAPREALAVDWNPAAAKHLTVWECVQYVARVLVAQEGGADAAARLVGAMGPISADARKLAYRLFEIASQKGWAGEALIYNELAEVWPKLEDAHASIELEARRSVDQPALFELGV